MSPACVASHMCKSSRQRQTSDSGDLANTLAASGSQIKVHHHGHPNTSQIRPPGGCTARLRPILHNSNANDGISSYSPINNSSRNTIILYTLHISHHHVKNMSHASPTTRPTAHGRLAQQLQRLIPVLPVNVLHLAQLHVQIHALRH